MIFRILIVSLISIFSATITEAREISGIVSGIVTSTDGTPIDYATIYLKGTNYSGSADEKGIYHIKVPAGKYIVVFTSVGYEPKESTIQINADEHTELTVKLKPVTELAEVIVVGNTLSKVRNSAFNATAVNATEFVNTTKTLSEALAKAPGMKIRESGGVGSDMAVTMDGFSGKHVKIQTGATRTRGAAY